jgi:hypothetical protein
MTITHGYCTLDDVKSPSVLGFATSDTYVDDMLESVIESTSRLIDDECHRFFYSDSDPVTFYYTAQQPTKIFVNDICSPDSDVVVEIDLNGNGVIDTTFDASNFLLSPYNAILLSVPYTCIEIAQTATYSLPVNVRKGVKVTARFGWSAVPKEIKTATIMQANRTYKRFATPLGSEAMTALGKQTLTIPSLDNDVQRLISRYKKVVFG